MRVATVVLSVTELQIAVREYVERNMDSPVDHVTVENGYGKVVLDVPLIIGAVIRGESFQRQTETP